MFLVKSPFHICSFTYGGDIPLQFQVAGFTSANRETKSYNTVLNSCGIMHSGSQDKAVHSMDQSSEVDSLELFLASIYWL